MIGRCRWQLLLAVLAVSLCLTGSAADQQPGGAAAAAAPASSAAGDWDWGGFTGLDDAPVTRRPGVSKGPATAGPARPKVTGIAAPDFEAPPRPAYAVFKGVPPFEVIPSKRDAEMHPCANCHQWTLSDTRPRSLKEPHDNFSLQHGLHGKGSFWCFTCHDLTASGGLRTLEGEKLEFGDAYILCSQCHSNQARDWVYGAHGKRVSGWQDKRRVLSCTACHYQHRPGLKPRAPDPGPVMRTGLQRPAHWVARDGDSTRVHGYEAVWNKTDSDQVPGAESPQSEQGQRTPGEQGKADAGS